MSAGGGDRGPARGRSAWLFAAALPIAAVAACLHESSEETASPPLVASLAAASPSPALAPALVATPKPMLPKDAGRFAPAHVAIAGDGTRTGAEIADVARCEPCHAEAVRTWRSSAHAKASFNNPLYRFSVDGFKRDNGHVESRFCGGCHDPALLVDGAMDADVSPDDARSRAGITCSICHTTVEVRPGGNAAYTLAAAPLMLPDMNDAASIAEHKRLAAPAPLRTAALCGTCHKAFLGERTGHPHYFAGQDEILPWRRSAFAGSNAERIDEPIEPAECRTCHMQRQAAARADVSSKDGTLASHRFPGGHTLLAAMHGDHEQIAAIEHMLRGVARVDVALARSDDGSVAVPAENLVPAPGARIDFDVVVRNLGVGHMFPGGTIDLQDTWLQVEVRDAADALIASAGTDHERTAKDPTAHRIRVELVDERGQPVRGHEVERIRAVGYNQAIPARDAVAVRYAFTVPDAGAYRAPLTVSVRLRHRARPIEAHDAACRDHRTARGRAFAAGEGIDACVEGPIVDIAEVQVELGSGMPPNGAPPDHVRLADHGQAMLKAVQEEVELARPSLEASLELARAEGDSLGIARALSLLGELSSRHGRADEALAWFAEAEPFAPEHPALSMGRGRALSQVWRFAEAAPHFALAAARAPNDDGVWAQLALALGSSQDAAGALAAAQKGLALSGRSTDLLRSQALALRMLAPGADPTVSADDVHLRHRAFDEAPSLRARCAASVPGCALERKPVHMHEMVQRR